MEANNVKVILIQPFQNRKTAETVARQTDAIVLDMPQQPGVTKHHHVLPADGSHRPNARQRFSAEELTVDVAVVWQVMKWPWPRLILPPLLVYLGLHVVEREVIFVDLALAQVATLGTCVALIMGYDFNDQMAFWISLGVTFLGAALFSWSRRSEETTGPAGSDNRHHVRGRCRRRDSAAEPGHRRQRRLEHLLTGDILNVTGGDVFQRAWLFVVLASFYAAFHKRFALISSDPKGRSPRECE